jgi:trehalose 6-phosphate synthase
MWFCAIVTLPRRQTDRHRQYQELCELAARRINERFAGSAGDAVTLMYPEDASSPRTRAVAALELSSTTLVNPTFDGLNMVAKEALVLNDRAPLLLSVNAGAFEQLASLVIPIHPFDVECTADALMAALHSDTGPKAHDRTSVCSVVRQESAGAWLKALLSATVSTESSQNGRASQ